jgi:hypothetical protein
MTAAGDGQPVPRRHAAAWDAIAQHYITKVRADLGISEQHEWLLAHLNGDWQDVAIAADMLLMDVANSDEAGGKLLDEGMLWILARIGACVMVGSGS